MVACPGPSVKSLIPLGRAPDRRPSVCPKTWNCGLGLRTEASSHPHTRKRCLLLQCWMEQKPAFIRARKRNPGRRSRSGCRPGKRSAQDGEVSGENGTGMEVRAGRSRIPRKAVYSGCRGTVFRNGRGFSGHGLRPAVSRSVQGLPCRLHGARPSRPCLPAFHVACTVPAERHGPWRTGSEEPGIRAAGTFPGAGPRAVPARQEAGSGRLCSGSALSGHRTPKPGTSS